ncbi:hypothetical protein SAMN05216359_101476 [Roseateles sp. YR242]|uniref:hypothetical protein n=1 Tax=Roseateles sp. YR242 TaxID=1855305 RepID=UPI0008D80BFF|nr:hypothetical protein [Roseateles sp. YR242]SEK33770.1 hypothetical protein SAMN05216359_101476 [Roseateles sp. YR242]
MNSLGSANANVDADVGASTHAHIGTVLERTARRYARRERDATGGDGGATVATEPELAPALDPTAATAAPPAEETPVVLAGSAQPGSHPGDAYGHTDVSATERHAGLGPTNASGREVERLLAERPERSADDNDDAAAGWLNTASATTPVWLVAGGGLVAAAAASAGGGGGAGPGGGIAINPPTEILPITPPVQPPVQVPIDPSSLGSPSLKLQAVGPVPVQGLPSTRHPVVNVGNLEPDGAWFYRVDGSQDWVRGQGAQVPDSVFQAQGQHAVEVYQMDLAGNEGPIARLEFWYDSLAPAAADVSLKSDTGDTTDLVTADATLVVGNIETGADWFFSVDGGEWQQGQGDEVPDAALGGDGTHTVSVVVRDPTGNESPPMSITVVRDTTAPTTAPTVSLLFDTGEDGDDQLTFDPSLALTGMEVGARWSISLDLGQTWIDAPDANELMFRDTDRFDRDGHWVVQARQIDAAGNVGTAISEFHFDLDRERPDAPTVRLKHDTGLFDDDRVTSIGTVVISDVGPDLNWGFRIDGAIEWSLYADMEIPSWEFGDGRHVVEVACWDAAGNRSKIERLEFVLDTQAPASPDLGLAPYVTSDTYDRYAATAVI